MNLELLAQWSQIVGALAFFVCVVLIWNKYIAPAVKSYQQAKNAELAEAEARRDRMRASVEEARGAVAQADADAIVIRQRMQDATDHDRAKIVEDATHEADRIVTNAQGELDRARMAARDRLRIEFIEKALVKARSEAPARVDDRMNEKLVGEAVDGLAGGIR